MKLKKQRMKKRRRSILLKKLLKANMKMKKILHLGIKKKRKIKN